MGRYSEGDLHKIKHNRCPRVVRDRHGRHLKARHIHRLRKAGVSLATVAILCGGVYFGGTMLQTTTPNVVDEGFVTVSYAPPTDGSTPGDHSALENIAYMNYRLQHQTVWYSEMHGEVDTILKQNVSTYKQFSGGVLIQTDITNSSMVESARQFCYVGDDVLWRSAAGSSSAWATSYEELAGMEWNENLDAHVTLSDFIGTHGLPGTSFSVYVINEDTLLNADEAVELGASSLRYSGGAPSDGAAYLSSLNEGNLLGASDVVDHGNNTYSQTFYLDPATDKAPCHYVNQMVSAGGLTSLPSFRYITVTYTFDSAWQVLSSYIEEEYSATMGVSVNCKATYTTLYEYDTPKAETSVYGDYFEEYAKQAATGENANTDPTVVDCLATAFGSVLTDKTVFDVTLSLNDKTINGIVYVDVQKMDIRARFGNLSVWFDGESAYLSYGGYKFRLSVEELQSLLQNGSSEGVSLDMDAILSSLSQGDFTCGETSATLRSELELFGISLPLEFHFLLGENSSIALGSVKTALSFGDYTLGASLTFGEGSIPALSEAEKDSFLAIVPYIGDMVDLFRSDVLNVAVSYQGGDLSVEGELNVRLQELVAAGELNITYGTVSKTVSLVYADQAIYLALDGLKVKANIEEVVALISQYVGADAVDFDAQSLLKQALGLNLGEYLFVSEDAGTLEILLKGTELLDAFGVDFAAGDVTLGITEGRLTASALGASVIVTEGEDFSCSTEGYTDVVKYVGYLVDLFTSETLRIDAAYTGDHLTVTGVIGIDLRETVVAGELEITYGGLSETVSVVYQEDVVYLALDGVKVKVNVEEAVGLISRYLNMDADAQELLSQVLNLNFGDYLFLSESEGTLGILVKGTQLLSAFGIDFDLGDVSIAVTEGKLTASGYGIALSVTEGEAFATDTEGYIDLMGILSEVMEIVDAQAVSFSGSARLTASNTSIALTVQNGYVSWQNGWEVYLDFLIEIAGVRQQLCLSVSETAFRLAYGKVGVEIDRKDLGDLNSAFEAVCTRIQTIVSTALEESNAALDENLGDIGNLLSVLQTSGVLTELSAELDLASVLSNLSLGAPVSENGVFTVGYGGLIAELLSGLQNGAIGLKAEYNGDVAFEASLSAYAPEGELPVMPDLDYLGTTEICELLDTLGAAVATLAQQSYTVNVAGKTTVASGDESGAVVYDYTGYIGFYSGGTFPIRIDRENQSIVVNTGLYLHVSFSFDNRKNAEDSIYLEFYVLDSDDNDELDFFFTLSRYPSTDGKYDPLKLYAPASEMMTVLSGGLALLGVNDGILNDYLISKWLEADTVSKLNALGSSLLGTLGFDELFGTLAGAIAAPTAVIPSDEVVYYLSSVTSDETQFTLSLNSAAIYGQQLPDVTLVVTKSKESGESLLTGVCLYHVYDRNVTEVTNLEISISSETERTTPTLTSDYLDLTGIAKLITVLADSATHDEEIISGEETAHTYALNRNFYINGTASVKILGIYSIDIRVVAISVNVDENGSLAVNIRLEYDGVQELNQVSINGDTAVDISLKNGMVYLKRTQYTYWQKGTITTDEVSYTTPVVIYRVMPTGHFMSDILEQMKFVLNMGSFLTNIIDSATGSSEETTAETVDYGTMLKNFLSGYSYSASDLTWVLTLNGNSLTGGVLSDIVVTMKADSRGLLRDLSVDTDIYSIITIEADFTYRNPQGVMEEGITDITNDVSDAAEEKMSRKLASVDWETTGYLEGYVSNVTYQFRGRTFGTQEVVYSNVTGECFTELSYPDLSGEPQETGYTLVWNRPEKIEAGGSVVYASYQANVYTVTLLSDRAAEGFEYDATQNVWKQVLEYTYDTQLELPVGYTPDGAEQIVAFRDGDTSCSVVRNITSDVTLTAVWEKIEYTVTYVAEGVTLGTQTAYFGDAYDFPAAPAKEGYDFSGWNVTGTVTGNVTVEALYEPKHYSVTLVSRFALEGYEQNGDVWTKTIDYVYGSEQALPVGKGYAEGYFLDGFKLAGDDTVYRSVPIAVASSPVLTAQWSELGYEVVFVADGVTVAVMNCAKDAALPAFPAVPERTGYTGAWSVAEDYVFHDDATVTAVYTANTYTVTVISYENAEGFMPSEDGSYFYTTYSYVYDDPYENGAIPLDNTIDIDRFDFGGYYTGPNGAGNRITELDNETALRYRELYLYWIDNTVTVTLCSDVVFNDYEGYTVANGYYKTLVFNDVYTLGYAATSSGYQQFGWWTQNGGAWTRVTDVKELDGKQIWAVWLKEEVTVVIDSVSKPSSVWSISGSYSYAWGGQKSREIIESIDAQLTRTEEVLYALSYTLFGSTKTDVLNSGKWQNDGSLDGTFSKSGMTSVMLTAKTGGAKVRLTFAYGDLSVTVSSSDYVWKSI